MKKMMFLLSFVVFAFTANDWEKYAAMIEEAIGKKELHRIAKDDKDAYRLYTWRIKRGYQVVRGLGEHTKGYKETNTFTYQPFGKNPITLSAKEFAQRLNADDFNILLYDLPFDDDKFHRIKIGNTGLGISIASKNSLIK